MIGATPTPFYVLSPPMSSSVLPWSYTSLDSFTTCPRRHKLVRLTRQVADPPGESARHGNEVHKAIERAITGQAVLPDKYKQYGPLVMKCAGAQGERLVEFKWGVSKNFQPVSYWDPNVWSRGVIDFGVINGDTATVIDWKTGKPKNDSDQLRLFAAATFVAKPYVNTVHTGYAWLAHDKLTVETYRREQLAELWVDFIARVNRMVSANDNDDFPPQPSGLCRKHCPVPKSLCEFSGRQ